jgi:hypothetical protein
VTCVRQSDIHGDAQSVLDLVARSRQ